MSVQSDYYIPRINELDAQVSKQAKVISTYRQALRDVAESEMIPTPEQAWEFCRGVAASALRDHG